MKKLTKLEVILPAPPERRRPGRPSRVLDLRKLETLKVAEPASPEEAMESLLVFDARGLDQDIRRRLLLLLPELVRLRHAWKAEFVECGCVSCHKKNASYGGGGFCDTCKARIWQRMRRRHGKAMQGRNLPGEVAAFKEMLCLRYNAAQRLFNEDD